MVSIYFLNKFRICMHDFIRFNVFLVAIFSLLYPLTSSRYIVRNVRMCFELSVTSEKPGASTGWLGKLPPGYQMQIRSSQDASGWSQQLNTWSTLQRHNVRVCEKPITGKYMKKTFHHRRMQSPSSANTRKPHTYWPMIPGEK